MNYMETTTRTWGRVLLSLLREPFAVHTATSLAYALKKTRQGIWKTLKKLEKNKLITIERVNDAVTSTAIIKLNWPNPITEKTILLLLTEDGMNYERWKVNFSDIEKKVITAVMFGSILHNSKEAHDIDILAVVEKRNFKGVEESIAKVQLTQPKKIHLVDLTEDEFTRELKKPNLAYRDAIKKGVVLYGYERFISIVRRLMQ